MNKNMLEVSKVTHAYITYFWKLIPFPALSAKKYIKQISDKTLIKM